jgi:hypothetical protein
MADALKNVLEGIQTAFASSIALMSVAGPYLHERPPGTDATFPYYVAIPEPSVLWGTTSTSKVWTHRIAFHVYAPTPELASDAAEVLTNVFDVNSFTLALADGHKFVSARRTGMSHEAPGKEVAMSVVRYEIMTSEPRT